jgi:Uma2 family endonuclease
VSERSTRWRDAAAGSTIDEMAVHVDPSLPVHPLTIDDVAAMVRAGILGEDDRVELLDGVLVEMSPQGSSHATAVRRLNMLLAPVAAAAGLEVSPQCPLSVLSPISQPEPDLAVVPVGGWEVHAAQALLVVEVSVTSRTVDLGRKAVIYATAGIPDYWVLDIEQRRLVVHRAPTDGRYETIESLTDADVVTAARLPLAVAVGDLLPPRGERRAPATG